MKKFIFNIGFTRLLIAAVIILTSAHLNISKAVQLPTITQRIETNPSTLAPVNVGANTFVEITPKTGSFTDISVVNTVEFGININYPRMVAAYGDYTVDVELKSYDQLNALIVTDTVQLTVHYDPASNNAVKDKDVFLVMNAWKLEAKIIALNGLPSGALPINLYLELRLDIDRVYNFASVVNTGPGINSVNLINIDGVPGNDEIEVIWNVLQGTDEYQLEWTFIDNYDTLLNDTLALNTLAFDFRHNSTRITTEALNYRIANVFERGWVLLRLRSVGRDMANPNEYLFSTWNNNTPNSGNDASVVVARIQIKVPHEGNKNWQAMTTFAEDGKKKDVVTYFDGSLRNRQTVSRMNTDNNVIVGETIYDHQGRPAITVLPTPTDRITGVEPALHFYKSFNVNMSGTPYNRANFDLDDTLSTPCNDTVQPMDTTSGASRYYSGNSTLINGSQAFVPDAFKYPFTQVEYTPDNTGRIRRQGSMGKDFQLGSGHEVMHFYGQPSQLQLDRLFGTEVGNAAHYKKNISIDANGQTSVTYKDMEGRVIASALAGDAPLNLDSLKYDSTARVFLIDMFAKDANGVSSLNTPNIAQNSIDFSTQLLVPYAGWYTFKYDFTVPAFADSCLNDNICFSCVYDLTLHITNECGENMAIYDSTGTTIDSMVVGHFDRDSLGNIVFLTDCTDSVYSFSPPYTDTLFLAVGNYTISKTLTVNEDAVDFYVDAYMDTTNNKCFKTLEEFQNEYVSEVDTMQCYIDCDDCIANLGDRDEFVAQGKGTAFDYDVLYETCLKDCKKLLSPCETAYEMMLADVSPGGQYGQYLNTLGGIDSSVSQLSIYNMNNHLPGNLTVVGAVTQNGTWHFPVTVLNGNTYNHYVNDDGTFGTVNVYNTGSGYIPVFTGSPLVDGSGQEYVYAENLVKLSDFIAAFKPEWAKGLVKYHPEYCYYEKCKEYGKKQGSEVLNSDEYDLWLKTAATFQEAQTGVGGAPLGGKFINGSGIPYNPSVTSTTNLYDPFVNPANSGVFGTASTQFMNKWNQYMPKPGGGWYNMYEAAAVTVRCGGLYGLLPGASCDDFGQPLVGLTTAQMTELLNKEWNTYKGFYIALKTQIQQNLADQYALTSCNGINDCIGNQDDFNPFVSGMIDFGTWSNSAYFKEQQPCSYYTRALYASKQTRFPDAQVIPTLNMSPLEAGYQAYLQTGQCPKAMALEGILNEMADSTKLDILTTEPLLPYGSYHTFYLIDNNYSPTLPITVNPLSWKASTVTTNYINVDLIDTVPNVKLSFELDKTGSGIANWDDIVMLSNLQYGPSTATTYPYQFTITARVETDTLDTCIVINGSTTYPLGNCTFPEVCDASPFAEDIQTLMSSLAATSQLTNSGIL